jgi:hypothetical protein
MALHMQLSEPTLHAINAITYHLMTSLIYSMARESQIFMKIHLLCLAPAEQPILHINLS